MLLYNFLFVHLFMITLLYLSCLLDAFFVLVMNCKSVVGTWRVCACLFKATLYVAGFEGNSKHSCEVYLFFLAQRKFVVH